MWWWSQKLLNYFFLTWLDLIKVSQKYVASMDQNSITERVMCGPVCSWRWSVKGFTHLSFIMVAYGKTFFVFYFKLQYLNLPQWKIESKAKTSHQMIHECQVALFLTKLSMSLPVSSKLLAKCSGYFFFLFGAKSSYLLWLNIRLMRTERVNPTVRLQTIKPMSRKMLKRFSEPRVTVALKDNFLEVHYFEQSLSHWKVTWPLKLQKYHLLQL